VSHHRRVFFAVFTALLLTVAWTGIASAHITSKSILTESGDCAAELDPDCDAAAVYGPNGFSGTLTFSADEIGDTVKVVDYICVHTPGDMDFKSFAGSYTLSLSEGGAPLGSDSYDVTGGLGCVGMGSVGVASTEGATIVVPADGTVDYTIAIAGVTAGADAQATFAAYNSIRNEAFDDQGGQARSQSVKPPTDFIIPEAPLAILILVTGGLAAAWFITRKTRAQASVAA
jgi:hypothetical protein